jgi:hypothetical protein
MFYDISSLGTPGEGWGEVGTIDSPQPPHFFLKDRGRKNKALPNQHVTISALIRVASQ